MAAYKIDNGDLLELLSNPKLNSTGQYVANCPFCSKESHFYINKHTQQWDCKKCGESGGIAKLLRYLGKTYLLEGATVQIKERIQTLKEMEAANEDLLSQTINSLPTIKMPVGYEVIKYNNKYLNSRGFTRYNYQHTEVGQTKMLSKFKNYLLFPVYENDDLKGFVGRLDPTTVKNPDNFLRYKNSTRTKFSELLYGYDDIVEGKTNVVILVEGIFDKEGVDRNLLLIEAGDELDHEIKCCCTFGKKISKTQIQKLVNKGVSHVILLYDWDAVMDMKKYGLELAKHFVTRVVYMNERKDVDEISGQELLVRIEHAVAPRDFNESFILRLKH